MMPKNFRRQGLIFLLWICFSFFSNYEVEVMIQGMSRKVLIHVARCPDSDQEQEEKSGHERRHRELIASEFRFGWFDEEFPPLVCAFSHFLRLCNSRSQQSAQWTLSLFMIPEFHS